MPIDCVSSAINKDDQRHDKSCQSQCIYIPKYCADDAVSDEVFAGSEC